MTVNLHREGSGTMAQPFLNNFRMGVSGDQSKSVEVP